MSSVSQVAEEVAQEESTYNKIYWNLYLEGRKH